ncbi:MAG: divalent-cation tolerance protein CutA [Thermoplasmata archaeon]
MKIVLTTIKEKEEGIAIIKDLLANKLAVCGNILEGKSVYLWGNGIVEENEYLLIIKTSNEKEKALKDQLEKKHPYEVPEIASINVESINQKYMDYISKWI